MTVAQVLGGRYEVLDLIGHGGMAVVCRAQDNVLGRTVAIKLLAGRHAGDPESRRRIRAEARAAATLSHPNIAQVYDYGESEQDGLCVPYVVMELIRGGTLQDRLESGPVSPRFAMRVAAEVAAALAAAHADGLVHRDIKPANVMVTSAGAKVVDFGIAAAISADPSPDPDAEVLGTPAYVAPERLLHDVVEPASDVYALGLLLYQLLSGQSPWSADSTTQMLTAHIYIEPTPLPQLPGVPDYVTALCNRCLRKDPTQRPSARETAALLAQGAGIRVVADEPAAAPAGPATDREPSVLIPRMPVDPPPAAPAATVVAAQAAAGRTGAAGRLRRTQLAAGAALVSTVAVLAWFLLPDGPDEPRGSNERGATLVLPSAGAPASPAAPSGPTGATPSRPGTTPGPDTGRELLPVGPVAGPGEPADETTGPTPTREAPGDDPEPTRPEPTPTGTPDGPPQERTLSSTGGSVRAACPSDGTAELLSWTPNSPYKVQQVDAGPAAAPSIWFRHGNRQVRMIVTCAGGVPSASTG